MTLARLAPLLLLAACATGEEWRITDSTTLAGDTSGSDDESGPQISASATVSASASTATTSGSTGDTTPSTTEPVEGSTGSTSNADASTSEGPSGSESSSGGAGSSSTGDPSTIDLSGWTIEQTESPRTFEIPEGTHVPVGGVLVVGRDVDQAAFEAYWGVTFGSDVVYLSGGNDFPTINGDETYTLRDDTMAVLDGPSPPLTMGESLARIDPEDGGATGWTNAAADVGTPLPGEAVDPPDGFTGAYLSEVSDANGNGNFVYEFVELRVF